MLRGLTEDCFQNWRAIAIGNKEHLLCLGTCHSKVRTSYAESFIELLTQDEQQSIRKIVIQRWDGVADCGRWVHKGELPIPTPQPETQAVPAQTEPEVAQAS